MQCINLDQPVDWYYFCDWRDSALLSLKFILDTSISVKYGIKLYRKGTILISKYFTAKKKLG